MRCIRCDSKLYTENDEELRKKYPLVCWHCDENMFLFEAQEEYLGEIDEWLEKNQWYKEVLEDEDYEI